MNLKIPLFDGNSPFNVKAIDHNSNSVNLQVTSRFKTAKCPTCSRRSSTVHSFYTRKVRDLPAFGYMVFLHMVCKKFFCKNVHCEQAIFTERFPKQFKPYSRMSDRLVSRLLKIGLLVGGNIGARISRLLNIDTSASTILRLIFKAPLAVPETPKVLGIDDWAYKKGDRYGTALVDLEKRRIIDLLPNRDSSTVKNWLVDNPGVEIITRDRYSNYAKGATEGCPEAIQVADRFHLLQNLSEALKKVLERNYKVYKKTLEASGGDEQCENNGNTAAPRPPDASSSVSYNKRVTQMQEVKMRYQNGESLRSIAYSVKLNRETVSKYLRIEEPPKKIYKKKFDLSRLTDQIKDIIQENKNITVKALIDKLRVIGYKGGQTTAYKFIKKHYKIREGVTRCLINRHLYFPTKAALLLSQSPTQLSSIEREVVDKLCKAAPEIKQACMLSRQFRRILILKRGKLTRRYENWLELALKCNSSEIRSYTPEIERLFRSKLSE